MLQIIFYVFAAILLFSAVMVISVKNPVHAAMFLVLSFFSAAAIWLLGGAEFLGIALVLVYVGAVMVLFLFVLMMLDINTDIMRQGFARYLPLGAAIGVVMVVQMLLVIGAAQITPEAGAVVADPDVNNIKMIGQVLYTVYVYPFELAAVVLLVAIIAAIMLTLHKRPGTKRQDVGKQVRVRKDERLKVISMPAEKRER
ncbi:NADH:ubiquinone oxidoreductase subunit J [Alkalilimnicola ehrlichii]|uniref:NADH-quinone oxidoreductase subunit J n=1 Tax=Alkalilimnicola ehrlichii TaxID=351052 RepID=A0A3E0X1U6_9GAMM|nr:NADH-quinone oxidoreductase subunit J [Alkalilimnicola ehrlichii]RFA30577.1 NADH:ubiquinone oxidoreductase subunit J [Alkalilimnicola ehrlichii]RFA38127.1 NADH:ubiquinone oxidoreductase subunit J [Alkalilimnicola ehrlichii]